ncbi:MAG: aspartate carbamoyltransferase [Clostridia bacterium]|nr:aspartate carbamoyltransferase [Clostridia bacterium]
MKHLLDITDLSLKEIDSLVGLAEKIMSDRKAYARALEGKTLATLFFEPSTRTRLSFEAAMLELGGRVLGFSSADSSSTAKGETVGDTARVVSCFADVIAMRHPKDGAAWAAAKRSRVPVVNAGDGGHCHPTQTLTDLVTIHAEKGRLDKLRVGIVGDLKYGRTVHSLLNALLRYDGNSFVLISPEELRLPEYMKKAIEQKGAETVETTSLSEYMPSLDVLYMTRIQRERFPDADEYERLKDSYVLTREKLRQAKEDMIVLHPLPRVNEIATDVDDDRRARYFEQVGYGKFARMALLLSLLKNVDEKNDFVLKGARTEKICPNARCVTNAEPSLEKMSFSDDGAERCSYCETALD